MRKRDPSVAALPWLVAALLTACGSTDSRKQPDDETPAFSDVGVARLLDWDALPVLSNVQASVKRIRFALDVAALDDLGLAVTWDAESKPAIDARLASLFACKPTPSPFETLPMSVAIDGPRAVLSLTLPMPFAEHAIVALTNEGTAPHDVSTHIDGTDGVPEANWGYLRTASNHRASPGPDERYEVAKISGRGKYVGTVLQMLGQANLTSSFQDPFNFLEATISGWQTATS